MIRRLLPSVFWGEAWAAVPPELDDGDGFYVGVRWGSLYIELQLLRRARSEP